MMREKAMDAHDRLLDGVREVTYLAFPDHGNVGDSAITLGMLAYLDAASIGVRRIRSVGASPGAPGSLTGTALFQGGGNLGGLYPHVDAYRQAALQAMTPDALAVHAPQSVTVVGSAGLDALRAVVSRPNTRLAVRDAASRDVVRPWVDASLSPDSVHLLGRIQAEAATRPVVVLARTDDEADGAAMRGSAPRVDWLREPGLQSLATRVRWQYRRLGPAAPALQPSDARWRALAERRLRRGVAVLSPGRTVVTDRLHAMLIALQMGRRVVAVDNANRKLSNYAATWFGTMPDDVLTFAPSAAAALDLIGEKA